MLTRSKLLKVLKNDYVQTVIFVIVIIGGVFSFWFGLRAMLRTDYPLLAVASGSMIGPYGLNIGDLIVVQGFSDPNEINAAPPPNGTMIVFYRPNYPMRGVFLFFTEYELIVHRAIGKVENSGTWYFRTKGDNNPVPDYWSGPDTLNGMLSNELVVGKVVAVIPWVGNVPLFLRTPIGMFLIVALLIIAILIEFVPKLLKKTGSKTKTL